MKMKNAEYSNIRKMMEYESSKKSLALDTSRRKSISSEVKFYTISDMVELLGWSPVTVKKLFNDPSFPAADFGKSKVVEAHALIEYFSTRHERDSERYWKS